VEWSFLTPMPWWSGAKYGLTADQACRKQKNRFFQMKRVTEAVTGMFVDSTGAAICDVLSEEERGQSLAPSLRRA
jgi:hypothetical protein